MRINLILFPLLHYLWKMKMKEIFLHPPPSHIIVTAQQRPQPNSTSTRVGVDNVISLTISIVL